MDTIFYGLTFLVLFFMFFGPLGLYYWNKFLDPYRKELDARIAADQAYERQRKRNPSVGPERTAHLS